MLMQSFIASDRSAAAACTGLLLLVMTCAPLTSLAIEPGRHFVFQQGSVVGDLQCPVKSKINPAPSQQNKDILEPQAIIDEMRSGINPAESRKVLCIADRREAIRTACIMAQPGDIILIAGKGHEKYQEIKGVKYPFDDMAEVQTLFNQAEN